MAFILFQSTILVNCFKSILSIRVLILKGASTSCLTHFGLLLRVQFDFQEVGGQLQEGKEEAQSRVMKGVAQAMGMRKGGLGGGGGGGR
jgi:hypothetical protein